MASNAFAHHLIIWNNFVKTYLPWALIMLLRAIHAPLDRYFILIIFLKYFKYVFQKNI
jgi:hypothetical protein